MMTGFAAVTALNTMSYLNDSYLFILLVHCVYVATNRWQHPGGYVGFCVIWIEL